MAARPAFAPEIANAFTACKQRLHPTCLGTDAVEITRALAALHATTATTPFLSLWARQPRFARTDLERETCERRRLARVLCMRSTLFVVPSDRYGQFFSAYAEQHQRANARLVEELIAQAGLCTPAQAGATRQRLQEEVLAVLGREGAMTAGQVAERVPALRTRVRYGAGRAFTAEVSIGARLVPGMCVEGLLVRAYPRGTWRSNLWHYARLDQWLPGVSLEGADPRQARVWLVREYLRAFGPATLADAGWWAGLAKGEIARAVAALGDEVVAVRLGDFGDEYLMLAEDAERLAHFLPSSEPYVFLLPVLDPYIMGYHDRRRFLAPEHKTLVFDYAGNARPTVWAGGRVVGVWREEKMGRPVVSLFATLSVEEQALLEAQVEGLAHFLGGD